MTAYAVGLLRDVQVCSDIVTYLERIDGTLRPYDGAFIIHGGRMERLEGRFAGDLIVIAFPDLERARAWYRSEAYQAILPLRTRHAQGEVFLIEGVPPTHVATEVLQG